MSLGEPLCSLIQNNLTIEQLWIFVSFSLSAWIQILQVLFNALGPYKPCNISVGKVSTSWRQNGAHPSRSRSCGTSSSSSEQPLPAPRVGPLEFVFTSETSFQRAGFTEISFLSSWSSAFALFLLFFLPKLSLCRVNCRKVMLKEKGIGFFFCFCQQMFLHGS